MLINRAAILLKAKQPAVDWINSSDPIENGISITLSEVNTESLIYLVPEDVESDVHAQIWVFNNAELLLEEFCHGWYQHEDLWPEGMGPKLIEEWFDVEYHSMIVDTVDDPIDKHEM